MKKSSEALRKSSLSGTERVYGHLTDTKGFFQLSLLQRTGMNSSVSGNKLTILLPLPRQTR